MSGMVNLRYIFKRLTAFVQYYHYYIESLQFRIKYNKLRNKLRNVLRFYLKIRWL
jgi:hypothetical protein